MDLVLYFLAGVFAAKGVALYTAGVTGMSLQKRSGRNLSLAFEVIGGSAALALGWLCWHAANHQEVAHVYRHVAALGAGAAIGGLAMAMYWPKKKA